MTDFGFTEAYRTSEFFVEIEGITSPRFTRVSGLSEGEVAPIDQADGGSNTVHKISSGIVTYNDLTLERNLDGSAADREFHAWFGEMFAMNTTGRGSKVRRNGSVVVYQHGEEVMRFVFEGAWIRSSSFTDLEAGGAALFKHTVVLCVERLYRVY